MYLVYALRRRPPRTTQTQRVGEQVEISNLFLETDLLIHERNKLPAHFLSRQRTVECSLP